ncbi:DRTGG domain-containing protein [Lachnospiraceae bacterium 62-35]
MIAADIQRILDAKVLIGEEHLSAEAGSVYSSDMMSDVLAFADNHSVLITGLCNPQVVRTAYMLDMACIIFVRGKVPDEQMCALAEQKGMVMLLTDKSMFQTCGLLYEAGLR